MLRFLARLLLLSLGLLLSAQAAPPPFDRLERPAGAILVPERFVRSWDALTFFFDQDKGPTAGGMEEQATRLVRMEPAIAGEWRWLNARTLQFRPTEAWPPLGRITLDIAGQQRQLLALLPAPVRTTPAHNTDNLPLFDRVTLVFPTPVDPAALARLLSIELRPLPAVGNEGLRTLNAGDFVIKVGERAERSAEAPYVVMLRDPVPGNHQIDLKLRLSDDPGLNDDLQTLRFRTAEPFRLSRIECGQIGDKERRHRDLYTTDRQIRDLAYCRRNDEEAGADKASPALLLAFNHELAKPEGDDHRLPPLIARNLLHFTPPVEGLTATVSGSYLVVGGRFQNDQRYTLRLGAAELRDRHNNLLQLKGDEAFQVAFAPEKPALQWDAGQGVVERLGPQRVPLRGRGFARADLRIHAIDPQSRDFWPFPAEPVTVDENQEPPLPGTEPTPHQSGANISAEDIGKRLRALGSPAFSDVVPLPLSKGGALAKFGLDLKPYLTRITGAERPGTYLVGLRPLDASTQRAWVRIQVTDLALTAVEEREQVHFFVTSLASAKPVAGAEIQFEGVNDGGGWCKVGQGVTDVQGRFAWSPPGGTAHCSLRRVSVHKGEDYLVLDPNRPLPRYTKERWSTPGNAEGDDDWLHWTTSNFSERRETPRLLCHLFTERPIYRPEEPVHIKGMVRDYLKGQLQFGKGDSLLVVSGPNDQEWRYPVKLDDYGGFYHLFSEDTPATGDYRIRFEMKGRSSSPVAATSSTAEEDTAENSESAADAENSDENTDDASEAVDGETEDAAETGSCGEITFKKEAYRLPTFEVLLNAPPRVSLESEFTVKLTARYFAGGLVADRPLQWRVAQFPYVWTPPKREGFFFSSDARFAADKEFRATPTLQRKTQTDGDGGASLILDPGNEPTAQPRRYLVEATVTGPDEMQARYTLPVLALPPFVLGVKLPRYFSETDAVEPEILVADADGKPQPGRNVTVRLIKRNWNSILQASDFSQGAARYVTETVDETLSETTLTSTAEVQKLRLPLKEAGVYVVQLEAADRLGRAQKVSVDFFVEGKTPVTWSQPPAQIVTVTADKDAYNPGETATLLVQSPFQTAQALAVVEEPEGPFRYEWVNIVNGYGRFPLLIRKEQRPKLPVHFLLLRGRLGEETTAPTAPFDLGKPVTLAATHWLKVNPLKNTLNARLEAPAKALPGQEIEVLLKLADDEGRPVAGEAVFWLVDQAIFALAKEQPLDPLPHFLPARQPWLVAHDSRSLAFGVLPLQETPGGDGEDSSGDDWGLDNVTVRKNFTPVPVFLPKVAIGADGQARVRVKLPDSLTVFKLRAKVVSGPERFGHAVGEVQVRQPILAQPALPRFVRPGDQFSAGLIGRVVEGPGGEGKAGIKLEGLTLDGTPEQRFSWAEKTPQNLAFNVVVPDPGLRSDGHLQRERARVLLTLERLSDQARDAVEISLPIQPDRQPVRRAQLKELAPGAPLELSTPAEPVRPGTVRRLLTVSTDPGLARLMAGLDTLLAFPYGCTEQRLSQAWVLLALRGWSGLLPDGDVVEKRTSAAVQAVAQTIADSIDEWGLVAFWPKSRGYVSLTAWSLQFLHAAEKQGEPVDKKLLERLTRVLKVALRSDYPHLLGDSAYLERATALEALTTVGESDAGYLAELVRRAEFLNPEAAARVAIALAQAQQSDQQALTRLIGQLWDAVEIRRFQGREVYAGLHDEKAASPLLLPSETRTLATILHAVALSDPNAPRLPLLSEALIGLGQQDGWGSTQADQQAIRALLAYQQQPTPAQGKFSLRLNPEQPPETVTVERFVRRSTDAATAVLTADAASAPLLINDTLSYLPSAPGSAAIAETAGFVVSRSAFRVPDAPDQPLEALKPEGEAQTLALAAGQVVEEQIEVVNPELRHHVIIEVPLAAGMEPLNARLANAPAIARPSQADTANASYRAQLDDRLVYSFDELPAGNYRFYFRSRATVSGSFTQPPATAEMMYRRAVNGNSAGARILIRR